MNTPDTPGMPPGKLTPARTVSVYALAFFFMLFLDAGRTSSLLERLGTDFAPATTIGHVLQKTAESTGLSALSRTETAFITRFTVESTLGARLVPVAEKIEPPHAPAVFEEMPLQPEIPLLEDKLQPVPEPLPVPDVPRGKPKVLLIGDSLMMEGFGPVLQRTLRKRQDMEVIREGRYSTGLSRMDYFDWPTSLQKLMDKYDPDLVVICMGANDPQDIIDKSMKRHHADSASWREIYQARAEHLLDVATERGSKVIWMGLPIMSKEPYATRVKRLSELQKSACDRNERALFIDTTSVLADANGSYTTFATDDKGKHIRLRYKDMVHVTEDGGQRLTANLVPYIERALKDASEDRESRVPSPLMPSSGTLPSPITQLPAIRNLAAQAPVTRNVPVAPATVLTSDVAANAAFVQSSPTQMLRLASTLRGKDVPYMAYVPTSPAGSNERFPVLYLLHGVYADATVWSRRTGTLLPELANSHRVVIIAPFCESFGWYADSPRLFSSQIESFMLAELMPHVEKTLPVLPVRGLAGISMGGHGAFALGLRHPGMFLSLSSMSGVMDITQHSEQWKIKDVFGPLETNRQLWERHSAQYLLTAVPPAQTPPMLVTAGLNDKWILQENRIFRDTLRKRGFHYQYRESPGGHDWNYWLSELPQHVAFHAAKLRRMGK